jgi:drug/metabolite transporter (DMT)-like permease
MVFLTTLFALPAIFVISLFKSDAISKNLTGIGKNYKLLSFLALSLLLNNFFYFAAFNRTSIAISVFTHYTAPLFVALLTPFLLAERFDRRLVFPLLIATSGLAAILAPEWHTSIGYADLIGAFCGIASGLAYAFTVIYAKRLTVELKPLALVFGQSLFISLFLLPFVISTNIANLSLSTWVCLAVIGVTHCTLAPLLYISGLKHIKAQHAAVIGYLEPLAAVILGLFLTHESPSLSIWFGGAAILLSGAVITRLRTRT